MTNPGTFTTFLFTSQLPSSLVEAFTLNPEDIHVKKDSSALIVINKRLSLLVLLEKTFTGALIELSSINKVSLGFLL